jgi:hypothetical protein
MNKDNTIEKRAWMRNLRYVREVLAKADGRGEA